ncbi:MAG: hypothetical protein ACK5LS_14170 [Propioniciclava sp.]
MTVTPDPRVTLPSRLPFSEAQLRDLLAEAHLFVRRGCTDVGEFCEVAADDHGIDEGLDSSLEVLFDAVVAPGGRCTPSARLPG